MHRLSRILVVVGGLLVLCLSNSINGSDSSLPNCDVGRNEGCGPGEKCTLVADGAGGYQAGCAPDGTVALGGACTAQTTAGGYDDCVAGAYCLEGSCVRSCDVADPYSCATGESCTPMDFGDIALCQSPGSPGPMPPGAAAGSCTSHEQCMSGRYCGRDGTCHPDSHRPRGETACPCQPTVMNFSSGAMCKQEDGAWAVCKEQVDIIIDGADQCVFDQKPTRCNWFGYEFDYAGFDTEIPIECHWERSLPADTGNREGIQMRKASSGTTSFKLPGASGHYAAPGFENYARAPGMKMIVDVRFDCYYSGLPLYETQYRLHYFP